jgi:hypothetical protein
LFTSTEPVKVLLMSAAPKGIPVKLKRPAALELPVTPTAEKELNVTPVAVGGGVGSVVPLVVVTDAKS